MRQQYIHKQTKQIIEAEQVPVKKGNPNYSELHGEIYVPSGYWKIWENGAIRKTAPNDWLFKNQFEPSAKAA